MKTITLSMLGLFLGIIFSFNTNAQQTYVADFENLTLAPDTFWNGSDLSGEFISGGAIFKNNYNADWDSWSGFAYSNMIDDTTAGFGNQYSVFGNGGADNSENFAINNGSRRVVHFEALTTNNWFEQIAPIGMYVNNATYAALSMRDGDMFAKEFGSPFDADGNLDGTNGEDYFLLTIFGYKNGNKSNDSVNFYLADYRDTNNQYIVNEWEWIDLTSLGHVDSLEFNLTSTDIGQWGMNTPAYFCFDNLTYEVIEYVNNTNLTETSNLKVYPNPAKDFINLELTEQLTNNAEIVLIDFAGKEVYREQYSNNLDIVQINLSQFEKGIYFLQVKGENILMTEKVIIQ